MHLHNRILFENLFFFSRVSQTISPCSALFTSTGYDIASVRKFMQVPSPHSFFLTFLCVVNVPHWVRRLSPAAVRPADAPTDLPAHGFDCVRSFLCQFFSMGVSSVFTLLLCGNTTFTLAVAFVSATMGLTTFSHRYRHPVCPHRTICLLLPLPEAFSVARRRLGVI